MTNPLVGSPDDRRILLPQTPLSCDATCRGSTTDRGTPLPTGGDDREEREGDEDAETERE
jgi:hypothetical protein